MAGSPDRLSYLLSLVRSPSPPPQSSSSVASSSTPTSTHPSSSIPTPTTSTNFTSSSSRMPSTPTPSNSPTPTTSTPSPCPSSTSTFTPPSWNFLLAIRNQFGFGPEEIEQQNLSPISSSENEKRRLTNEVRSPSILEEMARKAANDKNKSVSCPPINASVVRRKLGSPEMFANQMERKRVPVQAPRSAVLLKRKEIEKEEEVEGEQRAPKSDESPNQQLDRTHIKSENLIKGRNGEKGTQHGNDPPREHRDKRPRKRRNPRQIVVRKLANLPAPAVKALIMAGYKMSRVQQMEAEGKGMVILIALSFVFRRQFVYQDHSSEFDRQRVAPHTRRPCSSRGSNGGIKKGERAGDERLKERLDAKTESCHTESTKERRESEGRECNAEEEGVKKSQGERIERREEEKKEGSTEGEEEGEEGEEEEKGETKERELNGVKKEDGDMNGEREGSEGEGQIEVSPLEIPDMGDDDHPLRDNRAPINVSASELSRKVELIADRSVSSSIRTEYHHEATKIPRPKQGKLMKRNRRREPKQHRPLTDSEKEISGYLSGKWYCRMYENLPEVIDQSRDSVGLKMDVVKRIGRGGCGEVYMGKSHVDGKMIAIKRVLHSTAPLKAQNYREILILKSLKQPNIVQYYSSFQRNGEMWMMMEYMRGGTLSETVEKMTPSEGEIAYVAASLLAALSYLHKRLFAHRDLKSGNVMFSVTGAVKLIDFGLAADLSHSKSREETCLVGSPFWISPEMVQGLPHSFSTDIWSLGICLLELSNGKPPNRDNSLKALIKTGTEGVNDPFTEPNKWSPDFHDFMQQCLQFDAKERPTSLELLDHPFPKKRVSQRNMSRVLSNAWLEEVITQLM